MPSTPTIIGQHAATPLNTRFGDNVIGKLGQRRVEQANPPPPRTAGRAFQDFGAKVKHLTSRVLNAITPHGVRSDQKFRAGLKESSRQMGNLLGALTSSKDHQVDGPKALKAMTKLIDAMTPVVSRGGDRTQVFQHRLDTNLEQMSPKELRELRQGVAMAVNSPLNQDPDLRPCLALIEASVAREINERLAQELPNRVGQGLQNLIQILPDEAENPGLLDDQFKQLVRDTGLVLKEYGIEPTTENTMAAVKEGLEGAMTGPTLDQNLAQLGNILDLVSSKVLQDLRSAPSSISGGQKSPEVQHAVQHAIGNRMDQAENDFLEATDALLNLTNLTGGSLREALGDITTAAQNHHVITSHSEVTGLEPKDVIAPRLNMLVSHLDELLSSTEVDFETLSSDELQKLKSALTRLGVEVPEALTTEMTARKTALDLRYSEALSNVYDAVRGGNLEEVLRAVQQFNQVEDQAALEFQQLSGKEFDADSIFKWRDEIALNLLTSMSTVRLVAACEHFEEPRMRAFTEGLLEAGYDVGGFRGQTDHQALGMQIIALANGLERIKGPLRDELKERGIDLEINSQVYTRGDMPAEGLETLRNVLGVDLNPVSGTRVLRGNAPQEVQNAIRQSLDAPRVPSESTMARLENGTDMGISEIFRRDIGRGTYKIALGEGEGVPLLDRSDWNDVGRGTQDERVMGAIGLLNDLTDGDKEMVKLISQYAHQGFSAPMEELLNSPETFVSLPDGTPVALMGPETKSYTFTKQDDGSVVMRFEKSIDGATSYFSPSMERPVNIDPTGSHLRLSYELTFTTDHQVVLSQPVEYSYNIKPTSWPKDYPKPESLDDIVKSTNLELIFDFRQHLERRQAAEGLNFLLAHEEFTKDPTLEGARMLLNTYMLPGSEQEVTIDNGPYVERVRDTLTGEFAGDLTPEELVRLFTIGATEVYGMLEGNIFRQFITDNTVPV